MAHALDLRPLHQHGPLEPRPGGGNRARLRALALTFAATGLALAAFACGGGDDDDEAPDGTATSPASDCATDTAQLPSTPTSASKLLPSLVDLCLGMTQSGRDPAELGGMESAVALYKADNSKEQVQLRVYVLPSEQLAQTQFSAFAAALKNPPPEFVGVKATFIEADSPDLGQNRKSYRTETKDSNGLSVWADVYLKGRTVVLAQVVDDSDDGEPLRTQAAERALADAP